MMLFSFSVVSTDGGNTLSIKCYVWQIRHVYVLFHCHAVVGDKAGESFSILGSVF